MKSKCALTALFFLQASSLFPTTSSWNGSVNNKWDIVDTANWGPPAAVPNAVGDEADFNKAGALNTDIQITVPITVGTITIDSATPYTIDTAGGTLLLQNLPGNSALIQVTSSFGTAAHTILAPISLASPLIVAQSSSVSFTIGPGAITGSQTLTKTGTGVLVLSGANMYSGGTTISAGTLSISSDTNLGFPLTTAVTIGSATLQFAEPSGSPHITIATSRPFSLTAASIIDVTTAVLDMLPNTAQLNGVISGTGSLNKTDSGILQLGNAGNTYQGGTTISAGTLSISSDGNLGNVAGSLTIGGGTLLTTAAVNSNRSGSITGAAVINTGSSNDTFSGSFSGAGSLNVQGGGSVVLLGNNSYSGGTTIGTATKLAGTTNGLQGPINVSTASSVLDISQNFNGTYSGVLTGVAGSQLVKHGSGVLTMTAASPGFLGSTDIVGGTLDVNGSLSSSPVHVSATTTLSGSGTVGTTTSNGTIEPGNGSSVGTLSVKGTLTFDTGSHVIIDIAPITSNNIFVSTTATIMTGTSLNVDPTPGFYGFSANYTILTSTGLAGTFAPVTSSNPAFVPTVTYSATQAFLHVAISAPFAIFPFSNSNTAAVGNNFDALYAANQLSPDLFNIINTFVGKTSDVINDALDQMHPAPYSAFTELQVEMDAQLLSLFHRLPFLPCACSKPNRMWIEPFGNSMSLKRHGLEIGAEANSGGLAFGYDGQILENFVVGFGGAWNTTHLQWHDHRGHGSVSGLYGAIYFDSQFGDFYLGGSCLAGMDFYDTSRHIQFITTNRRATANYEAADIMGQISTAYLFGSPQVFFYPYANLDYLYLHTHKISESKADGLDLTVQPHTDATLRTEMGLGLQVQDTNAAETMCISPLVSIGWVNMAPLQRPLLKSTFAGATIPFKVKGWDETWNLFNANFGLSLTYRCYSMDLQYNAEMSADKKTLLFNQRGGIRFDWKW